METEGWRQRERDKGMETGLWRQRYRDRGIEPEVVEIGSSSLGILTQTNPLTGDPWRLVDSNRRRHLLTYRETEGDRICR